MERNGFSPSCCHSSKSQNSFRPKKEKKEPTPRIPKELKKLICNSLIPTIHHPTPTLSSLCRSPTQKQNQKKNPKLPRTATHPNRQQKQLEEEVKKAEKEGKTLTEEQQTSMAANVASGYLDVMWKQTVMDIVYTLDEVRMMMGSWTQDFSIP